MGRARQDAGGYVMAGLFEAAADVQDAMCDPRAHAHACRSSMMPSSFSLLYESADKRLCVFEDDAGHVSAVDASRLA